MIILIFLIVLFALWSLWGYFSSRVEQTDYTIVQKARDYEIREYPAHIVAQATVRGTYRVALNQGFRIVAGYIFGGNTKKQNITMTAPVTTQKETSEKIAMTAPVLATTAGDSHIISFGMPRSYTLQNLPMPNDPRVAIVMVPVKKFAAVKFSWYQTDDRLKKMEKNLLSALGRDHVATVGSTLYARYNAPWTPPWMTRNEVLVEIAK